MGRMTASPGRRVLLAAPRGYCAGVDRAVIAVEKALEQYGAPVYVRHEIVHNKYVVQTLEKKGAIFVEQTEEVPPGNIVMFSAHGVAPVVHEEAERGRLATIDATCPLVTKVHKEAVRFAKEDYDILLIGHEGHEEVIGTSGEAPDHIQLVDGPADVAKVEVRDPSKVVWLSQTTLSVDETMETVDALKEKFPQLISPPSDDICYATQNRQLAVKQMGAEADLVIVVGSRNSSNSKRLVEVAKLAGARAAYLVDFADEIDEALAGGRLHGRRHLGRLGAGDPGRAGPAVAVRARLRGRRAGQGGRGVDHLLAAEGAPPRPARGGRRPGGRARRHGAGLRIRCGFRAVTVV